MEGATVPRTRSAILKRGRPAMPLLRFDLVEGRSESEIRKILDTTHEVLLQVTSRPRSREMKENFYRLLVERLATRCGISPDDVIVNCVTNADEDWSFGAGRAQFLTGELSTRVQAKARIGSPA